MTALTVFVWAVLALILVAIVWRIIVVDRQDRQDEQNAQLKLYGQPHDHVSMMAAEKSARDSDMSGRTSHKETPHG